MIDFPAITAFCELAECLNFTQAAERLYTTQSSLSKTIARLEETMNCKLFFRNNRNVTLSPAGLYLYKHFKVSLAEMHDAVEIAKQYNSGFEGIINISASGNTFAIPSVTKILWQFKQEYPLYALRFDSPTLKDARNNLITNSYDALIVRVGEIDDLPSCTKTLLTTCRPVAFVGKNHPVFAKNKNPTLKDLAEYSFVSTSPEFSTRVYNNTVLLCKSNGFVPNIVKRASSVAEMMIDALVNNFVGILDEFECSNTELVQLPIENVGDMQIVLAWNTENANPALAKFVNFVEHNRAL